MSTPVHVIQSNDNDLYKIGLMIGHKHASFKNLS